MNRIARVLQIVAVLALLCIIVNPELRVFIFFVDFVGAELALLLIALQARGCAALLCQIARWIGHLAVGAFPREIRPTRAHRLLCPMLITLSLGLRCR